MVICTIQARMSSGRFPGKVLKELWNGMSVLEFMIQRLRLSKEIDHIVVLTTLNRADKPIIDLCRKLNCNYHRGNENDVMDRMIGFLDSWRNHDIIDLTSDCPFISPFLIDMMLEQYSRFEFDYLSNCITRTYPNGFDIQIYKQFLIEKIYDEIQNMIKQNENHKSHTGWNIINYSYLLQHQNTIKIGNWPAPQNLTYPEWGLTLDTTEDLILLKNICNHFNSLNFSCQYIIEYLEKNPELLLINQKVKRKTPGEG